MKNGVEIARFYPLKISVLINAELGPLSAALPSLLPNGILDPCEKSSCLSDKFYQK